MSILLTSHYLEEVQELSDRIVMIRQGRVVADDSTNGILEHTASTVVRVTTLDDRALTLPGVIEARREGDVVALTVRDASTAMKALSLAGVDYSDVDIHKPSLEEAFTQLSAKEQS
ncbi:hypothetical protein G7067_00220 [Leucobacter insecticola]|uniref:DUF4162 domain-containing protein n=1 Tax=Leucobacter insecticola TaxID=2714934 RepID=A0A6G8FG24_9MICO|nr:hypothetical protein [Leucobacter insecticola]QIM15193.1 hypothetical protein G7067_00220 [Leucobacter insecticola]